MNNANTKQAHADSLSELGINRNGISRRTFLKRTALGSAFLVTATAFPTGCTSYEEPKSELTTLSVKEAAVALAVAETVIWGVDELPAPGDIGFVQALDKYIGTLPKDLQTQMKLLLNAFEHLPIAFSFRLNRFTRLSPQARVEYLNDWAASSLGFRRMAFTALKSVVFLIYYSRDETWGVIGYDGPWVGRIPIQAIDVPKSSYTESDPLIDLLEEVGK